MVFLSRKKPPPPPPPSSSSAAPSLKMPQPHKESVEPDAVEKMTAILAEVGCTLMNPYGPPCLPSDLHAFRRHLTARFSSCSANSSERDNAGVLHSVFVAGFSSYIQSPSNLRRSVNSNSSSQIKTEIHHFVIGFVHIYRVECFPLLHQLRETRV